MQPNRQMRNCHVEADLHCSNSSAAFSLIELLIVLALLIILTTMYWGFSGKSYQRGKQRACQANLQKIYVAMQIYGNESKGNFPVVSNAPTSEVPLDLLVPKYTADTSTFVCPGSKDSALPSGESLRKGRVSYSYYMGRKAADASEALLSDKQVDTNAKTAGQNAFSPNGKYPGNNHHQYGGNFLFVDGHAETIAPSLPFSVALPQGVVLLNPKP